MSQAAALAEAKRLQAIMTKHGVRCSIELQVGRPYSGDDWYTRKYFRMHHHTATYARQGDTPALKICKTGRSGLPGPLCNGYGGRDLIYRVITMGLANHPGAGGPITIDGKTIPKDSARITTWGTEWEGGYETWTPAMLEFMGRSDAALAEWMGRPVTSQLEHSTWTPRKIDRYKITRSSSIALSRKWWNATIKPPTGGTSTTGDEMTFQQFKDYLSLLYGPTGTEGVWYARQMAAFEAIFTNIAEMKATLARIEDDTDDGQATHAAVMAQFEELKGSLPQLPE